MSLARPAAGENLAAAGSLPRCALSIGALLKLDPRVDDRVQEVHDERHQTHDKGIHDDDSLDRRIVSQVDSFEKQPTHARPGEGASR